MSIVNEIYPYDYRNTELTEAQTNRLTDAILINSADRAFSGCRHLRSLNGVERTWDTSQVTSMKGMFAGCQLRNLDLSGWDTSNVTDMEGLFQNAVYERTSGEDPGTGEGMYNIYSFLDLSGWDTSKVTNMDHMFAFGDEIGVLDLSNFSMESLEEPPDLFGTLGRVQYVIIDSAVCKFWGFKWPEEGFLNNVAFLVPYNLVSDYRNYFNWCNYEGYIIPIEQCTIIRITDGENAGKIKISFPEIL